MLAAHTTTGDWIIGGIALVVGLALLVGLVWLLYRLVTWPFRRRRSAPTGLGSEYEQMVRQQQKRRWFSSPNQQWEPWQPPAQPQTISAAASQVVMPPRGYRPRNSEAGAEPEPVSQSIAAPPESTQRPPSTWDRVMRTPRNIPAWLTMSLATLGLWSIVSKPFFDADWASYGVGLVAAAGMGVWAKRNYHAKILWRAPRNVLVWQRWGKEDDSLPLPGEVQAAAEAVTAMAVPDSVTPDAALDG